MLDAVDPVRPDRVGPAIVLSGDDRAVVAGIVGAAVGGVDVRLLDATGEPYNEKNLPRDGFEKAAIAG